MALGSTTEPLFPDYCSHCDLIADGCWTLLAILVLRNLNERRLAKWLKHWFGRSSQPVCKKPFPLLVMSLVDCMHNHRWAGHFSVNIGLICPVSCCYHKP